MTDWTGPGRIERDGYRIEKSHVRRLFGEAAPVYHCYAPGGLFLGVTGGGTEAAKALCAAHRQNLIAQGATTDVTPFHSSAQKQA